MQDAIKCIQEVTDTKVERLYADKAYQSEGNRAYANQEDIKFVFLIATSQRTLLDVLNAF